MLVRKRFLLGAEGEPSMPEFYDHCTCRYQLAAQPYLDAIARGIQRQAASRAFLLWKTEYQHSYSDAEPLWQEQWKKRDPRDSLKCPFWSNYSYNPCQSCNCRIDGSASMEIDAMFFLRNSAGKTMAIHIEVKRHHEPLLHGQAEAYRLRAACYRDQRRVRRGIIAHDHFITVLVCGAGKDVHSAKNYFDRVILHEDAREVFLGYPIK
jgi:hypothetical protein